MKIEKDKSWTTAFQEYESELKGIISGYSESNILELGAGRYPSFRLESMPSSVRSYTVNDISQEELALLPPGYEMACFDVGGDASNFQNTYDVVFSRFLAEHVADGMAMHRNVFGVLRDGGTAFHLLPTLYAFPFVVNKLFPEQLTSRIVNRFTNGRAHSPKFPAYYSQCYGNARKMKRILENIGYSKVEIRNFYGHLYYEKFPIFRDVHEAFSGLVARMNWTPISSYIYITATK